MRAHTFYFLISLGAVAFAQTPDLSGLPTCAQTPALQGASSSGCSLTDAECFCKNTGFIDSLKSAISSACTSASDQQAACAWGNSACSAYGVSIPCDNSAAQTSNGGNASPQSSPVTSMSANMDSATVAPTDAAGNVVSTSSVSIPTDGGMASVTSGSGTSPSVSGTGMGITSIMNTTHTSVNMTHAPTMIATTTSAGQTSKYTGAGNTAARQSGIIGAVIGVAFFFALF